MEISKLCCRSVVTVRELDELIAAAQLMRTRHVGYVVVVQPGLTDGLLEPVVVAETESISGALGAMREIGVRRLPIVGARGQLVGVLSIDDILEALADELNTVAGSIRNEQSIESALRQ
jgi:predicted transcriptional regulator